jgi:hypothetical protein
MKIQDVRARIVRTIFTFNESTNGKQYYVDQYGNKYEPYSGSMQSTGTNQTILTFNDNGVLMQKLS